MSDFKEIYSSQGVDYDALVSREDYRGDLLPALTEICDFSGAAVVELGAGTGRLTRMLAPLVSRIYAFDISAHMLGVAAARAGGRLCAAVSDNRKLAVKTDAADVAVAGWSLGHFTGWHPQSWRDEIGQAVAEMKRVVRPGGTVIILETQGTGRATPLPPSRDLAAFYGWMVQEHGFTPSWIRTDYRFESTDEARHLISFFFGDEMVKQTIRPGVTIVPECTGIWWLTN